MSRVHLDLKIRSDIPNAYLRPAQEISRLSGLNLGNLAFRHALKSIVQDLSEYEPLDYPGFRKRLEEERVDDVIVSCANWLGTRKEDEASNKVRADLIERVDGRVVSLGLGVQATQGTEYLELGPQSQRLAMVLASKAKLLSVRDQLTARTLRAIGVENVCVTGCPSNFINTSPTLGAEITERAQSFVKSGSVPGGFRTAISEFSGGHPQSGAVLRSMLGFIRSLPAFYIVQSPALLSFVYRESEHLPGAYTANSEIPAEELMKLLKSRSLAFSSIESWLDFSRTCELSFGMRIHGTIVPLQAGVPSLLIGHDSRTSGLAEEMGIPVLTPEGFLELGLRTPTAMFELIGEQMERYDANRMRLAKEFKAFLVGNGVSITEGLLGLADR
jgi:hypothetical protein